MRRIISLFLVAVFLVSSVCVLAYEKSDLTVETAKIIIKEDQGTGELASYLVAKGSFAKDYAGSKLMVSVTKKGVNLSDTNISDSDKYFGIFQYYIEEDGTFDISEKISLAGGDYIIYITADGLNSEYTKEAEAIPDEILTKTESMLLSLKNKEATVDLLTPVVAEVSKYLTDDNSFYDALSYDEKKLVSEEIIKNLETFTTDEFVKIFDKAVVLVCVNTADNSSTVKKVIEKYKKQLELENNPLYLETSVYDKSDNIYSFIYNNRTYIDCEKIATAYFDGYVISKFKNAMASNIKGFTENYKNYLNIEPISGDTNKVSAIESYIYQRLGNVSSITDLITLIAEAKNNATGTVILPVTPTPSVGGGGGGGANVTVGSDFDNGNYVDEGVSYGFSDVSNTHWGYEAITYLNNGGILSGKGDNMFFPDDNVTRAEFVKILVTAYNIESSDKGIPFSDVDTDDWFYQYVEKAYNFKIISGISEAEFIPDGAITRQDAAVILKRIFDSKGIEFTKSDIKFKDSDQISDYAKDAVDALSSGGIIKGFDDNTFKGNNKITRAEAAQLIYNAIK